MTPHDPALRKYEPARYDVRVRTPSQLRDEARHQSPDHPGSTDPGRIVECKHYNVAALRWVSGDVMWYCRGCPLTVDPTFSRDFIEVSVVPE